MFPITMLKMMAFAERAWMSGLAEMVKIEHWEAFLLHVVIWLWFMGNVQFFAHFDSRIASR